MVQNRNPLRRQKSIGIQRNPIQRRTVSNPQPTDDRLMPTYPLVEVSRLVGCHPNTLRSWLRGRHVKKGAERHRTKPMIETATKLGAPLTFLDLVEAHVLVLIRRGYGIPMKNFRTAMQYLKSIGRDVHFLSYQGFLLDKNHLYMKEDKKLISLSERGQQVNTEIIHDGLKQIVFGDDGYADRFYPLLSGRFQKAVVINPRIGYGQPILERLGVSTQTIDLRFRAGEHLSHLAADYGATTDEIEEALRCAREFAARVKV